MIKLLRIPFAFILNPLEKGTEAYAYKPSHRTIMIAMSFMFLGLAGLVCYIMPGWDSGYLLPILFFGGAGLFGLIVGFLGEDRAVARLWGSK